MLQAFVFERVGVVVGDLYFLDPDPHPGQQGPEHGVRLELRVFNRGELKGTIYSATPIEVGQPIWRADLLESVDGKPGSFHRTPPPRSSPAAPPAPGYPSGSCRRTRSAGWPGSGPTCPPCSSAPECRRTSPTPPMPGT